MYTTKPQYHQMGQNAAENRQYTIVIKCSSSSSSTSNTMSAKKTIGRKVKDRHNGYVITFAAASITHNGQALVRYPMLVHRYNTLQLLLCSRQFNFIADNVPQCINIFQRLS